MPHSLDTYATFSEIPGIGVNDQYIDPVVAARQRLSRHSGKQFNVEFPKDGSRQTVDGYLQKSFPALSSGDRYIDAYKLESMMQSRDGEKVSDKPFKPPRNPIKPSCPGAKDQCIGSVPFMDTDPELLSGPKTDRTFSDGTKGKKKIYTSPAPRGGFGFPMQARTIGGNAPDYMVDTYQAGRIIDRKVKKEARARIPKPFNSGPNRGSGMFWGNPYAEAPGPTYDRKPPRKPFVSDKQWKNPGLCKLPGPRGQAYASLNRVGLDYIPIGPGDKKYKTINPEEGRPKAFVPPSMTCKERTGSRDINPFATDARPPASLDFTLVKSKNYQG